MGYSGTKVRSLEDMAAQGFVTGFSCGVRMCSDFMSEVILYIGTGQNEVVGLDIGENFL